MTEMTSVLIEIKPDNLSEITDLEKYEEFTIINSDRFDGESIVQFIVTLSAVSLPIATKIIIEKIKSNKHVIVKKDGMIVKGLNANDTMKVLKELKKDD